MQRKTKEIGLAFAALAEPAPRGGGAGEEGSAGAGAAAAGGAVTRPANPMAPADWNPRFVNGRRLKAQPICAVVVGNLFNDDKILSLAHQYQTHTDVH